jgi:hypothetical protein
LGCKEVAIQKTAPSLAVDIKSGKFVATCTDTAILAKFFYAQQHATHQIPFLCLTVGGNVCFAGQGMTLQKFI